MVEQRTYLPLVRVRVPSPALPQTDSGIQAAGDDFPVDRTPDINQPALEVIERTIDDIEANELLEYQFLFALVGHIRGHYLGLRKSDKRSAYSFLPMVHEFARQLTALGLVEDKFIDWSDSDSLELEFLKAWGARQLPKDSNLLELAVDLSVHNPLGLPETMNRWVSRLANVSFILSEFLPDVPHMIPVNDRTAELCNTTLRTLSLALQELIRERLVIVVNKSDQSEPLRRARKLKFNSKHRLVANRIDSARKQLRSLTAAPGAQL